MSWLFVILLAFVVLMSLASLSTAWQFRQRRRLPEQLAEESGGAPLPTSVIIPCKGDDGTLLENLETVVAQDHPDIEFVLVTATEDDPAQAAFRELKRRHPQRRIKTVAAGISPHCSQQNNNQVQGVAAADPGSKVFVVMDSDGQSDPRFVANLVTPLSDPQIGATTGFRWYDPDWGRLADVLRCAWNAGGFVFLVHPPTSFVWGGALALRRETYEEAGVAELWAHALSDDMTLSQRLRSRGLALRFVPRCIVVSREKDTLSSLIRWTNRQTLITRFYNPAFWIVTGIFHGVGNLLGWGLLITGIALLAGGRGGAPANLALATGLIWIVHLWLFGAMIIGPIETLLEPRGVRLGARRWLLVLLSPLASLIQGINSINSLTTRRIVWAGITYEIDDAQTMRVL